MRSTATFDPDVSSRFQRLLTQRKQTRKTLLNEVMRRGLDAVETAEVERKPFVLVPFESGPVLDNRLPSVINAELELEEMMASLLRSSAA